MCISCHECSFFVFILDCLCKSCGKQRQCNENLCYRVKYFWSFSGCKSYNVNHIINNMILWYMIFMICIKSYFRQDFCICDRSHVCTHWRLLAAVMIYRIEIDIPKAFISYNLVISHNTLSLLLISHLV